MALPPSAIAARERLLALQSGNRPTIHGAHFSGATSAPGAGGVDPFAAFPSLQQRTTPDNLGGKLPYTQAQQQQQAIGQSLINGEPRPSFGSINLPAPPQPGGDMLSGDDPVMGSFASITGIQPVQKKKPLYSSLLASDPSQP